MSVSQLSTRNLAFISWMVPINHTTGFRFNGTKFLLLFAVFHFISDLEFKEKVFDIRSVRRVSLESSLIVLITFSDIESILLSNKGD